MTELTGTELQALRELEDIIARGIESWREVGQALLEINRRRLYVRTHATFDAYCRDRWKFSRGQAYRLISASEVMDDLASVSPIGNTATPLPATESQARPLGRLDAEGRREAWQAAIGASANGTPTANEVARAADDVEIERITRKAIAGMSPAAQLEVVQAEEKAIEVRAAAREKQEQSNDQKLRVEQGERRIKQAVRLYKGLGDPAAPVLALLDKALTASALLGLS